MVAAVLASAFGGNDSSCILEEVESITRDHAGATHAQVALAWLLAQPAVDSVILGVRTLAQLEDNLGSAALSLSAEELESLDAASAAEPPYPYRFLQRYGVR